jgi:hypothetical protein
MLGALQLDNNALKTSVEAQEVCPSWLCEARSLTQQQVVNAQLQADNNALLSSLDDLKRDLINSGITVRYTTSQSAC